jgi:hypothetical protein
MDEKYNGMKSKLFLYLIIILAFSACKKEDNGPEIINSPESKSINKIISELQNAYDNNSDSTLNLVLDDWKNQNPPKEISSLSNPAEKAIYELYLKFYNPNNIDRYGQHEWGNDIYKDFDYAIIQNKIYYSVTDDEPDYEKTDSLFDFRPPVCLEGKTILYLTQNYNEALNYFLNPDYDPKSNIPYFQLTINQEGWDHFNFLVKKLAIIPGHWGGYWHIETHPEITYLVLSTSLKHAKINFRIAYEFGEAIMEKKSTGWEMISSAITMIE